MKQIVDKLNKIAKKINENVELSDRDLIIDSLDSITKAYGGTPNDSTLIVDKLDDIYNNISSAPSGNIAITENTAEGTTLNIEQFATATVNVSGWGMDLKYCEVTIVAPTAGRVSGLTRINDAGVIDSGYIQVNNGDKIKYYYTLEEGDTVAASFPQLQNAVYQGSNYINCEPIEEGSSYVIITDPTQNSSFTLTVTSWGGGA